METVIVITAGVDAIALGAILRNRRKIQRLERRVRALGVVESVIQEAARPAPADRAHLHLVSSVDSSD